MPRIPLQIAWDCVKDFGVGIPPERLHQIFEPFMTTGRDKGGTGLGLAIVYNLVTDVLKGAIDVESCPDMGTAFTITFPKNVPESDVSEPRSHRPPGNAAA